MRTQTLLQAASAVCALLVLQSAAAPGGGKGGFPDCNNDGIDDTTQLRRLGDCNQNGIPDVCDIDDGTSEDCNKDGIPDECPVCPPVDVVFVMDTSGSMNDEADALCNSINQVVSDLMNQGITVNAEILGITKVDFTCLTDFVANLIGSAVPGNPSPGEEFLDDNEDWGPATAVVADGYAWTPGAVRVIVPISDEGPEDGDACDNADDAQSIVNAIAIANINDVIVSPIAGTGSDQCVIDFASQLASATGGTSFLSTDPDLDLADAISMLLLDACQSVSDCDEDGVPDECETDSDNDGTPDDCEVESSDLDCAEFDRFEDLTPNDTLSLVTKGHNPNLEQGYLYVSAVDGATLPIAFDQLIGHSLVINGFDGVEYSTNAVDYRAAVDEGLPTDVDADGHRDLNGLEYEQTAGEILVPRFLGQDEFSSGELLLIALSGGRKFVTTVDFLIYNDNEVGFSAEHTFRCWDRVPLTQISNVFGDAYLRQFTGSDPDEDLAGREYGWMRIDGGVAISPTMSIQDPAFYAVYVERLISQGSADLPFERCLQSGHLLPNALFGDNEETPAPTQTCDESIGRRQAGSLLLFPEFDNRTGLLNVITVTNTSATESTRVHYVYIGRFGS